MRVINVDNSKAYRWRGTWYWLYSQITQREEIVAARISEERLNTRPRLFTFFLSDVSFSLEIINIIIMANLVIIYYQCIKMESTTVFKYFLGNLGDIIFLRLENIINVYQILLKFIICYNLQYCVNLWISRIYGLNWSMSELFVIL